MRLAAARERYHTALGEGMRREARERQRELEAAQLKQSKMLKKLLLLQMELDDDTGI